MRIFLGLDWKCLSDEKIAHGKLGNTERRMLGLKSFLEEHGHVVIAEPEPPGDFDVAVFSNSYQSGARFKRSILWAGSWHADPDEFPFDRIVWVSEFMKEKYGRKEALVVSAFHDDPFFSDAKVPHVPFRIVSTSNPNRYIDHAATVAQILNARGITNWEWHYCGGNKLYASDFPECFARDGHERLVYRGVLGTRGLVDLLRSAHVWVYPNLTDGSETFCAAAVEAVAMGIPVIVPSRQPFIEVLQGCANYAANALTFSHLIEKQFKARKPPTCDISRFEKRNVLGKMMRIIEDLAD